APATVVPVWVSCMLTKAPLAPTVAPLHEPATLAGGPLAAWGVLLAHPAMHATTTAIATQDTVFMDSLLRYRDRSAPLSRRAPAITAKVAATRISAARSCTGPTSAKTPYSTETIAAASRPGVLPPGVRACTISRRPVTIAHTGKIRGRQREPDMKIATPATTLTMPSPTREPRLAAAAASNSATAPSTRRKAASAINISCVVMFGIRKANSSNAPSRSPMSRSRAPRIARPRWGRGDSCSGTLETAAGVMASDRTMGRSTHAIRPRSHRTELRLGGQLDVDRETAAGIGLGVDPPAVGLGDRTADRQAHAEAAILRGDEAVEHPLEVDVLGADPGVAHGELHQRRRRVAGHDGDLAPRPLHALQRLGRVHQEIEHDLLQLDGIARHRGQPG